VSGPGVIREATEADLDEVRTLFREYQVELATPVCFLSYEQELATLPGSYDPILISPGAACVALRALTPDIGEMKRLYVRPSHRGIGLGRRLTQSIIEIARGKGFRALRLDTLPQLTTAIAMYRSMGFHDIERYYDAPAVEALFLELHL
jgi:ribosomal protein S18 acetylase RimI-like enzyme